jgi:hypothetical protein
MLLIRVALLCCVVVSFAVSQGNDTGPMWKVTVGDDAALPLPSPSFDCVIGAEGNDAVCREASTGAIRWKQPIGDGCAFRIARGMFIDDRNWLVPTDTGVDRIDVRSGSRSTVVKGTMHDADDTLKGVIQMGASILKSPFVVDNLIFVIMQDACVVLDRTTLSTVFEISRPKTLQGSMADHRMYIYGNDTVTTINTSTAAIVRLPVKDREPYYRVRTEIALESGTILIVSEEEFMGFDEKTGAKTLSVALDPTDIDNYRYTSVDGVPYLMITDEDKHTFYNARTGSSFSVPGTSIPGVIDRFGDASAGVAIAVSFDDDDSMSLSGIDVAAQKFLWRRTVGWGRLGFRSGHVPRSSTFLTTLIAVMSPKASDTRIKMEDAFPRRYDATTKSMVYDDQQRKAQERAANARRALAAKEANLRMIAEVARKPFDEPGSGAMPRRTYGEADLISAEGGKAVVLLYGGIYRPHSERTDFPDAEGLYTIDVRTGAVLNMEHITMYGHRNTLYGLDATYVCDVRETTPGCRLVLADSAIVYIAKNKITRQKFWQWKIAIAGGTADSMWVVDNNEDTDVLSTWLLKITPSGTMQSTLMARSEQRIVPIVSGASTAVGCAYINDVLTLYRRPGVDPSTFTEADKITSFSEDALDAFSLGRITSEDQVYTPSRGLVCYDDVASICGSKAILRISTVDGKCHASIKPSGDLAETSPGVLKIGRQTLLIAERSAQSIVGTSACTSSSASVFELSNTCQYGIGTDHVMILDADNRLLYLYRR